MRIRFLDKRGAASLAKIRRRRCPSGDAIAGGEKEFVYNGWRAEAEQQGWAVGFFAERMGRIGRDTDRFARLCYESLAARCKLGLSLQDAEQLIEAVPVGGRPASERDVHINQAVVAAGIFARPRIEYVSPTRPTCDNDALLLDRAHASCV